MCKQTMDLKLEMPVSGLNYYSTRGCKKLADIVSVSAGNKMDRNSLLGCKRR